MSTQPQNSNIFDADNVMDSLKEIVKSEAIVKFKLVDAAKKILLKMMTEYGLDSEKFFTLAEIRRGFRSFSSQDAELIIFELRDLNLLENRIKGKSTIVFRYNPKRIKQENLLAKDRQEELKYFIKDRTAKRIEFYERKLNNLRKNNQAGFERSAEEIIEEVDKRIVSKTAKELHESKECDPNTCKFCGLGL